MKHRMDLNRGDKEADSPFTKCSKYEDLPIDRICLETVVSVILFLHLLASLICAKRKHVCRQRQRQQSKRCACCIDYLSTTNMSNVCRPSLLVSSLNQSIFLIYSSKSRSRPLLQDPTLLFLTILPNHEPRICRPGIRLGVSELCATAYRPVNAIKVLPTRSSHSCRNSRPIRNPCRRIL